MKDVRKKKGRIAAIFKLKDTIVGKRKSERENTTVLYPKTKKEVYSVEEIKSASLHYCENLLTNRLPRDGYEPIIQMKYILHDLRMEEYDREYEIELSYTMFTSALNRLMSKHPTKYSFILKAGNVYDNVLVGLF